MTREPPPDAAPTTHLALLVAGALALAACGTVNPVNNVAALTVSNADLEPGSHYLLRPRARHSLPAMHGDLLNGRALDLADLRGQVVVVNVWASWCAPCIAEAPELAAVRRAAAPQGVQFVSIDIKDERSSAQSFQRNRHAPYPSIYDQPGLLLLALGGLAPQSPPTTLLLDKKGRIVARFPGGVTRQKLLGPTEALAAEPAAAKH